MTHVKFRRWGPYVWWICPSRKCNFENKTDLAFVQGAFDTKCQYCNTPITIKMIGGQLSLESTAVEEEEPKTAAAPTLSAPAKPPGASPPQSIPAPKTSSPPTPSPQASTKAPSTQAAPRAPSEVAKSTPPTTPAVEAPAQKPESASGSKETKKKAAS